MAKKAGDGGFHRTAARAAAAATVAPASVQTTALEIDLKPAPEAGQALTLRGQAAALHVRDQESHRDAVHFIRGAKQLKRTIEDHWSRITRNVDALKRSLLDLKAKDLDPVVSAIEAAEAKALEFENADRRRVEAEERERRRVADEQARTDRERELAEQERKALELEAGSAALSNREQYFVDAYVAMVPRISEAYKPGADHAAHQAATRAGYKDPKASAQRLLATDKILTAVKDRRAARELREQQEALRRAPVESKPIEKVERQTAKVSGVSTRTYYSAAVDDRDKLVAAVLGGEAPSSALTPDLVELNRAATDLKDQFESVYPGCRLIKRQGIAG